MAFTNLKKKHSRARLLIKLIQDKREIWFRFYNFSERFSVSILLSSSFDVDQSQTPPKFNNEKLFYTRETEISIKFLILD